MKKILYGLAVFLVLLSSILMAQNRPKTMDEAIRLRQHTRQINASHFDITGIWYYEGKICKIEHTTNGFNFTNEGNDTVVGRWISNTSVVTNWPNSKGTPLVGKVVDAQRIEWENNTVWVRAIPEQPSQPPQQKQPEQEQLKQPSIVLNIEHERMQNFYYSTTKVNVYVTNKEKRPVQAYVKISWEENSKEKDNVYDITILPEQKYLVRWFIYYDCAFPRVSAKIISATYK